MRILRTFDCPQILLLFIAILMAGCGGGDGGGLAGSLSLNAEVDTSTKEAEVGQTVYFSLYGSSGPIEEAGWQVLSAPAGSNAMLDYDGDIGYVWLIPDAIGSYTIRGTVFDGSGNSDSMDVSITAVNATPVAVITALPEGGEQRTDKTIELSGAASSDANDSDLSYSWSVEEAPIGSTAALNAADAEAATFVADVTGEYTIKLIVSDGEKQDVELYTFYADENYLPVIVLNSLPAFLENESVSINASNSTDMNGDTLTFTWELVTQPPGAAAVLESSGPEARLMPDGLGEYGVHLAVSDGFDTVEKTFTVSGVEEFLLLEDEIADAEYDSVNDRIVLVSQSSSQLIVVDAVTGLELGRVDLPRTPIVVSVSPDGNEAVVGHDGLISVVDLATLAVVDFPFSGKPSDVVHGGNGYAYVFTESELNIQCVDLATGVETDSTGRWINQGTLARKQPGSDAIYGADNGLSPADIEKYDISGGTAAYAYDSPYHGDYPMCGNLWFTDDGAKIITACGNTFTTSDVREFDMQYAGALELEEPYEYGYGRLVSVDHSGSSGVIASIRNIEFFDYRSNLQTILRHDATSHALVDVRGLPAFQDVAGKRSLDAMFVFHQPGTDKLLVVADIEEAGEAQTIILRY